MNSKTVLIVTYYWPPAGGIAVQRITKFCKYLTEFGWTPVILTVSNGNYESVDESLLDDIRHIEHVHRAASFEPHNFYRFIGAYFGARKTINAGKSRKLPKRSKFTVFSEYIRLNLFIPDTRVGWLFNAYRCGKKIIQQHNPDLILSTAPPYTSHLVAMKLHKYSHIPWVADFRDPWVESTLYNTVKRLGIVKTINRNLERKVLLNATALTFTGPKLRDHYKDSSNYDFSSKANVITNGYDPQDVPQLAIDTPDKFYITYFGSLYTRRYHPVVFETLSRLLKNNSSLANNICLRFIGNVDIEIKNTLSELFPEQNLEFHNYIPYKDAVKLLYSPQLLLLTVDQVPFNDNITLGKIFDYLPTGNPILGIAPLNGDTAYIINTTNSGKVIDYDDSRSITAYVLENYEAWKTGNLKHATNNLIKYQRKYLTAQLAELLDNVANQDFLVSAHDGRKSI